MSSGQATEQVVPPPLPPALCTITEAVEVSFPLLLSATLFDTEAVLEMVSPTEAVPTTEYVERKIAVSPLFKLAIVQTVSPVPPAVGLVHAKDGPLNWKNETKVVFAGTESVN